MATAFITIPQGQACANIGPKQRLGRLLFGLVTLALGLAAGWWLLSTGSPRLWRVALFLPFVGAATGIFQAQRKTCIGLERKGVRNMDTGEVSVQDDSERAQLKRQANLVRRDSVIAAVIATALALLVP